VKIVVITHLQLTMNSKDPPTLLTRNRSLRERIRDNTNNIFAIPSQISNSVVERLT
jgi:hypothetical protein